MSSIYKSKICRPGKLGSMRRWKIWTNNDMIAQNHNTRMVTWHCFISLFFLPRNHPYTHFITAWCSITIYLLLAKAMLGWIWWGQCTEVLWHALSCLKNSNRVQCRVFQTVRLVTHCCSTRWAGDGSWNDLEPPWCGRHDHKGEKHRIFNPGVMEWISSNDVFRMLHDASGL